MDGYKGTGPQVAADLSGDCGDDARTAAARAAYLDAEARLFLAMAERDGSVGPDAGFRAGCGERLEGLRLVHAVGPRHSARWGVSARGRAFLEAGPPPLSERVRAWLRAAGDDAADRLHLCVNMAILALAFIAFYGLWCLAVSIDRIGGRSGLDASREQV